MSQPSGEASTTTSTDGQDTTNSTATTGQPNTQSGTQTFTQADIDRVVAERLNREKAKYADYDQLKERAGQWEKFVQESKPEQEKALDQARQEAADAARNEVRSEFGGKLVAAHITAAAAGRLNEGALNALLAGIDKATFLTPTGDVDAARITQFIDGIAPATTTQQKPGGFGQGTRPGTPAKGVDAGAAVWEQRHAKGEAAPLFT